MPVNEQAPTFLATPFFHRAGVGEDQAPQFEGAAAGIGYVQHSQARACTTCTILRATMLYSL
eukprot:1161078-Pelagomonas_calceolata.AAC.21